MSTTAGADQFRQTYLDTLLNEIREIAAKEDLEIPFAAGRAVAQRLGYDTDVIEFVDGAGDRGIDFWHASDSGLYIYQVKTHELTDKGFLNLSRKFDNSGVTDLMRAHNFLLSKTVPDIDERLGKLKDRLNRLVRNYQSKETEEPLDISLNLILLGDDLTNAASKELEDFAKSIELPVDYDGVKLHFHVDHQILDDIVRVAWQQVNHVWINFEGKEQDKISLTPMRQAGKLNFLSDGSSAIFYCRAVDLVRAYDELGYQIFEPNVRANIKNSSVNDAIQKSASHHRSMKEFRFLNNGLTITCNSYKLPVSQRPTFEVQLPGIINGLQTVLALWRAYRQLPREEQVNFDEKCFVLVRLLRNDAVNQISDVVLATNNQNPMQPRNLKSNTSEQIHFAQHFATEHEWFYEAKQGAWEAFKIDPSRWRPRINQRPQVFKGRKGIKKIDNLDLAQDWLAFLGYADKAANEKRDLFNDEYYKLIFLSRPRNHRYPHNQSVQDALTDIDNNTPDPATMLAAHIAKTFASEVVPSSQANRKAALERHGVYDRESISPPDEEEILSKDSEYILNQALNAMSLIFAEFVGYSLFREFGEDAHRCGSFLLNTLSWNRIYTNLDWYVGVDKVNGQDTNIEDSDLLVVMWLFFREAVETLMGGAWQTAYLNARYKPRFLLNQRDELYRESIRMDESLKRKVPMRVWTHGIKDGEGFFGYMHRIIHDLASNQR